MGSKMGGAGVCGCGGCLLVILLLLPEVVPSILPLQQQDVFEHLGNVEVENAADSDIVETDGLGMLGGFGYSNTLADFDFPVIYRYNEKKDVVDKDTNEDNENKDVVNKDTNEDIEQEMKHVLYEESQIEEFEELETETIEEVENENYGESNIDMKEESVEVFYDALLNVEKEKGSELSLETEIQENEVTYDEIAEEEFKDESVNMEQSLAAIEEIARTDTEPEDVSTEIISEVEEIDKTTDTEFVDENGKKVLNSLRARKDEVMNFISGNEDEFNSFSQKIKIKEMEINEDKEIDHEEEGEEEDKENITFSCAS